MTLRFISEIFRIRLHLSLRNVGLCRFAEKILRRNPKGGKKETNPGRPAQMTPNKTHIMDKITYRLVFNRKNRLNGHGTALVQVEAYMGRKRKYFTTNVYLTPRQWDARRRLVRNHPNAGALNRKLYAFMGNMERAELELWRHGRPVSLEALKAELEKGVQTGSFTDFFRGEAAAERLKPGTRRNHLSTLKQLTKFRKGLAFGELNAALVQEFEQFLLAEGLHVNTVAKHMTHLKRYVNLAEEKGLLENGESLFRHHRLKTVEGRHSYLTPDELALLERLWLPEEKERLRMVLDAFLFCCYAGLRYSDFTSLTPDNIATVDGRPWLIYRSVKTGVGVRLPLYLLFEGKALALLRKHERHLEHFFRLGHNSNVNKALRRITRLAGLKKDVTFHTARHTNATLLIYKGVNITTVQKLLGHKSVKTTQVYAQVMDMTLLSDLKKGGKSGHGTRTFLPATPETGTF